LAIIAVSLVLESTDYPVVAAKTLLAGDLAPTKGRRRPDVRHGGPTYSTLGKSGNRAPHGSFILCASFFGQSAVFVEPIDSVSLLSRTKRYFCIGDRNDYVVLDGGRDCVDQKPRPSCRGCFCKRTVMRLSHFRCVRRVTSTWHRLLFLPRGSAARHWHSRAARVVSPTRSMSRSG
jgi:hypothetical protein